MQNTKRWIDEIILQLFEAEDRILQKTVTQLHRSNCEIKRQQFPGFIHMGKKFVVPGAMPYGPRTPFPSLAFSLLAEANQLMIHFNRLELDKSQIRQILFQQLQPCETYQEIRDSLPECLIPLVPRVKYLTRVQGDPLFKLHHNKIARDQYHKVLPKIEMYAMSRMMY